MANKVNKIKSFEVESSGETDVGSLRFDRSADTYLSLTDGYSYIYGKAVHVSAFLREVADIIDEMYDE